MSTSTKHPGPPQPPDFLTIEEAARIARIGRTTAYDIAREFETTAGASGLPVVRFGKQLRVPRFRLETWLGGPITWPIADHEPTVAFAVASITPAPSPKRSSRRATLAPEQDALSFPA